ncbi:neutral zinc metallopeptidase [Catenuloplanes atrovinosus]|uniref:Metalloprotease n=1 Tax=Catenuloplanes atrovinosus TaxID=137266 RepID=A0AAE4C9R7_9ACTN|nr:neutral zinc metallopeptidase [Catenuloplanes atrovinosus]MDR7276836.1 putative metalloprotease [Catenuloplanes atrovinosus]
MNSRGRTVRGLVAGAATLALLSGCVVVASGGFEDTPQRPGTPGDGLGRTGAPVSPDEANRTAENALTDVERYWAGAYPRLAGGAAFEPVRGGRHPYTRNDPPPACGDAAGEYQPNAYYCPADDYIAWDAEVLVPQLHQDFGALLTGVVLAHEYGHAVQTRLGVGRQPTVVLEQQADCYAGAWVGDVIGGRSATFAAPTARELDDTVAGILQLRDEPGTSATNPQAHGNAFDRIRAFQDGVEEGPARCAGYDAENLPITEVPFTTREEAATGGDLPYDQTIELLGEDVQEYWARAYPRVAGGAQWAPLRIEPFDGDAPRCEGRVPPPGAGSLDDQAFYCASGGYVAFDNTRLGPALHDRIGDNALGMLIGGLFAQAVQERRGRSSTDRDGRLATDCLAGTWTYDLLNRGTGSDVRLSPGDLDEAVTALLTLGRSDENAAAGAFDRIAEFRDGALEGIPACSE